MKWHLQVEQSFMTFEGGQFQGATKILEKLKSLAFQKIFRSVTAIDTQPMFDGGVLVSVLGRLQVSFLEGNKTKQNGVSL